jgi:predicted Kef-type K+ transport protein
VAGALAIAVLKLALLVAFTFILGGRIVPRILNGVTSTHSRELFTLTVLVLALGIAVGSAMLFGASMALGAFLAGMIVGQSEFSFRAASEALPCGTRSQCSFRVCGNVVRSGSIDTGVWLLSQRSPLFSLKLLAASAS